MAKRLKLSLWAFIASLFLFVLQAAEPDCELLQYNLKCKVENGILFEEYLFVLQINNRAGESNARVSIPFTKSNKILNLKGAIEDPYGRVIRQLSRKDITDVSAVSNQAMYTDDFVRKFELIHNQYPYRIRYSYRMEFREFFYIANWIPLMGENIPTHQASLTIDVPMDYTYRVKSKDIPFQDTDTLGTNVRLSYKVKDIPPYHSEQYAPSPLNSLPYVIMVPANFRWFANGSHATWQTFGQWMSSLIEGADLLPEPEHSKARSLVNGITDKTEKIKQIYAYLQDNTRYINVKIDVGGLKPYPATYVAHHKYGDCKALSNYMKALLKAADIPSYYAMIKADENPVVTDQSFPSQQFNHVIVYVPLERDTFFLECTNNTSPFGYIGTSKQNRPVFIVDGPNSHFVSTPALTPEEVLNTRNLFFSVRPEGSARLDLDFSFRGGQYELFDAVLSQLSIAEQEKFIKEYLPAGSFELTDWKLDRKHRDTAIISLTATLNVLHAIKTYGNDISIQLFPVFSTVFETPEMRKLPVAFNYPVYTRDSLVFMLPQLMQKSGIIHEVRIGSKYGEYSRKAVQQGNQVVITRSLLLHRAMYPLNEYPEFYKFITEFQQADKKSIFITR